MTMRLNPRQTGNKGPWIPCINATAVVRAMQRAEWEEGMPPEAISIFHFSLRSAEYAVKTWGDEKPDLGIRSGTENRGCVRYISIYVDGRYEVLRNGAGSRGKVLHDGEQQNKIKIKIVVCDV